jgi:restriction system protein
MPIPDFQSIMLPLLQYLADGRVRSNQEMHDALAKEFELSDQELREMLPSGKMRIFVNRLAWAKSHLKQAGLVDSPKRGQCVITQRGRQVADSPPERITIAYLKRFPEFERFRGGKGSATTKEETTDKQTPAEDIEKGFQKHMNELARSLDESIRECSPQFFEKLVVDLLLAMGYGGSRQEAAQLTAPGADGGIDGVINEDRLGLDVIYVQAKRWDSNVGRQEIQKFAGALQGKRAKKGVFITTSDFTPDAREYVRNIDSRIILVDGGRLAELMIEHNVGVSVAQSYDLKKIDTDFFLEE